MSFGIMSLSPEVKKRPNGITIIGVLLALTAIFNMYNLGLNELIYDFAELPYLNDPSKSKWLSFGVPADIVLNLSKVALSISILFVAYGLFAAKSWSYKPAFALPVLTVIVDGAATALYASAPAELELELYSSLYLVLTLIDTVWIIVTLVYLRRPNVKQYLMDSSGATSPLPLSHTPHPPLHWATHEGDVIKAIVSNGRPLTWKEIQQATGLDEGSLNKALANLFYSKEIRKTNNLYRVSHGLFKEYQAYLLSRSRAERKTELIEWINQWKTVRNLDFSLEHEHFFLEGRHLDDFSKELISRAKSEVLIVNPFIQDCDLSNTLAEVGKHGIKVQIITRSPRDRHPGYLKNKQEYLSKLENEGVVLVFNEKVHAKLLVVDQAVAIVSSMNLYPDSSAGVSWEAGIISTDKMVIDSMVSKILRLSH